MKKVFSAIALVFAIVFSTDLNAKYLHGVMPQDDGHGHTAEELPELMFTKIIGNYEVYISMHTLIVGEDSHFHVNLTNISTYKPVNDAIGFVTIGTFTTKEKTSKNGIFHFGFKPAKHGKNKIAATIEVNNEKILFELGDINIYSSVSEAAHAPHEEKEGEIILTKDWMWNHSFGIEVIESLPFNEVIRSRGEILPSTNSKAVIVAPTSGVISFPRNIVAGKKIKGHEAIAFINGTGLENNIESRYKKLEAGYQTAKNNYERNKVLYKDLIVSEQDLQNSYDIFIAAQEDFNSLSKIYTNGTVRVSAPYNAILTDIMVSENQFVQAGEIIATANLEKEYMLKVEISKYNYSLINRIVDANFIPEYSEKVFTVSKLGGSKLASSLATKQNSAYIPVYFSLPKNADIIPFSYTEVYSIVGSNENVVSVPNAAIIENEGLYWVYVQTNGERFEKRDVTLGGGDGYRRIVLSGLKPGEIVVTNGSAKVRQSETSGVAIPHGHSH